MGPLQKGSHTVLCSRWIRSVLSSESNTADGSKQLGDWAKHLTLPSTGRFLHLDAMIWTL